MFDKPPAGLYQPLLQAPLDALVVVGAEKLGLLDPVGQVHAPFEDAMQPGRADPAGSDPDEIRQSQLTVRYLKIGSLRPPDLMHRAGVGLPGVIPSRRRHVFDRKFKQKMTFDFVIRDGIGSGGGNQLPQVAISVHCGRATTDQEFFVGLVNEHMKRVTPVAQEIVKFRTRRIDEDTQLARRDDRNHWMEARRAIFAHSCEKPCP
jgi:hypothetical protein